MTLSGIQSTSVLYTDLCVLPPLISTHAVLRMDTCMWDLYTGTLYMHFLVVLLILHVSTASIGYWAVCVVRYCTGHQATVLGVVPWYLVHVLCILHSVVVQYPVSTQNTETGQSTGELPKGYHGSQWRPRSHETPRADEQGARVEASGASTGVSSGCEVLIEAPLRGCMPGTARWKLFRSKVTLLAKTLRPLPSPTVLIAITKNQKVGEGRLQDGKKENTKKIVIPTDKNDNGSGDDNDDRKTKPTS